MVSGALAGGDVHLHHRRTAARGEHDHVGLGHGLARLQRHLVHDAFFGDRLETARVDDQERPFADPAFAARADSPVLEALRALRA